LSAATGVFGDPAGEYIEFDGTNLTIKTPQLNVSDTGDAWFGGVLTVAKIDAPFIEIKANNTGLYSRPSAYTSDWISSPTASYTAASGILLGVFIFPPSPNATSTSRNLISTQNGYYVTVSGMLDYRDTSMEIQYRSQLSNGSYGPWYKVPQSIDYISTSRRMVPISFSIPIFELYNPSGVLSKVSLLDMGIEFRLKSPGSGNDIFGMTIAFSYSNIG